MHTFEWSSLFETGLTEVDAQHQQLVALLNQLADQVQSAADQPVEQALAELARYTVYHFTCEERLMREAGIAAQHAAHHHAMHERFVGQVQDWLAARDATGKLAPAQMVDYLSNWLIFHILGEDQSMGRQVLAIRAGASALQALELDRPSDDPRTDVLLRAMRRLYMDLQQRHELLVQTQDALRRMNESLEQRVQERTAELAAINARLQQEQQRAMDAEKMASLGRMVAGFAHELNTPVGVAIGAVSQVGQTLGKFSALLQGDEVSAHQIDHYLALLQESQALAMGNLERSAALVKSFKRTAVDQTSEAYRNYQMDELLDDVVRNLHPMFKRTAIEIAVQCPPQLLLYGVPGVLTQVLTNLCTNAYIHAFAEGARSGRIEIAVRSEGDCIELIFSDNGAGIDPAHEKHVFEPFYTTNRHNGGSGLGLYIVYNLVTQSLGGSIVVETAKGQGTTFRIRFSRIAAAQEGGYFENHT